MNSTLIPIRKVRKTNRTCKLTINNLINKRQIGVKKYIGFNDEIIAQLYNKFDSYCIEKTSESRRLHGGIFNLDFNHEGNLLLAACEKRSILMYDACNQKLLKVLDGVHDNCVNCIRFLDDKLFATCSDDRTIKLWDIRNLRKNCFKILHGHSNWVKNIEYCENEKIMVTSAFDGTIYSWDLKSPTENSMLYDKVFLMSGLMRIKLSPDGTKLIISTTSGYIIIIHDLNISTVAQDFKTFRPVLYRLMQISNQCFPAGTIYNHLFHPSRERNRVEFIDDFQMDTEVISSLQIHPYGWNILSRSLNNSETEEMTNVHDIQKRSYSDYEHSYILIDEDNVLDSSDSETEHNQRPTDLWIGYISNYQNLNEQRNDANMFENFTLPMDITTSGLVGRHHYRNYFQDNPEDRHKVITNLPRLTHYIEERNVGRGYIKELCYSPDGRIICSPFDKGIRLLGFNDKYEELTYCVPNQPKRLTVLMEMNNYHKNIVVSCKFNPKNMQLVSGCLNGEIIWYKPIL